MGDSFRDGVDAINCSLAADMSGAPGPVPTVPVSPLTGSDCCSLTFNSPEWVDLLVTFIACEIVTGRGLTEILGSDPGRFCGRNTTLARPENATFVHIALRQSPTGPYAPVHFQTSMA